MCTMKEYIVMSTMYEYVAMYQVVMVYAWLVVSTPLCRLCGRLGDLISEPTRAVGATVTAGIVILIGLPRMAR